MNEQTTDSTLFKAIFESSVEGILVVAHDGSIQRANTAGESMFCYSQGELIGKKVETLIPQKFRNNHESYRIAYSKKPKARPMGQHLDLWGLRKDGSQFPLKISLSPANINGQQLVVTFVMDITEQKKAEVTSFESNRKLSTLIDNLQGIVYRCKNDRDWTMEYISDGCLPFTGYTPKEFLEGKVHFSRITFQEDQEEVWNLTQKGIEEKKPFNLSYRIRDKKGNIKHMSELGQAIFDRNGNLEALEGFITDITGQKETESLLRANEAKNKALLDAIPDMIFVQNHKGDYLECFAPEPEKLFMTPEEFIGKNMKEVLPPHVHSVIKRALDLAIQDKNIQIGEYSVSTKEGESFYEARVVPMNKHAVLTIVRDVTEKKLTEKRLTQSLLRNKALLQAIPDTIKTLDAHANYLEIHTQDPDWWLVPKEQVIGHNMREWLSPENYKKIKKAIDRTLTSKDTQLVEYGIERGDGFRYYETRTVFLSGNKVLAIARDITKRKKIEQELLASETMNRGILQAMPDIFVLNDREGKILELHTPDPELLLANVDELIGKNFRDVLPDTIDSEIEKVFKRVHRNRVMEIMETTLPGRNKMVDFEARIVPLENGKSLSILRNVTKTKAVQDILYVRNRALEAAGNGIIIADAQENDFPIIYSNKAFTEITGYSNNEILGKNCRFLQNNDRQQEPLDTIRKAIKDQVPCRTILRNYRKDATLFYNELTLTPVFNDLGKTTHFIGVQNDVTERRKEELFKEHIRRTLEMIAQHKPLKSIGKEILKTLESSMDGGMASILKLNPEKRTLHKLVAPNLPESFNKAMEGVVIGPKVGSCGSAAYLKKEVVVADISKDKRWKDYKGIALKNGLRACWSYPVLSSDKQVLGTFAIYHTNVKKPTKEQEDIIANLVQLTSLALEQYSTRGELERSRSLLQSYALELEEKVAERTDELKATVQKLVETNLSLEDQIKETKAAENRALESQAMFAAISKNFPKGFIVVFNTNFEIEYVDGGEMQRYGFDKSQLEGKRIDNVSVLPRKYRARIKKNVEKTMNGAQLSFEGRFEHKTYCVNTSPLLGGDGEVEWMLFVYSDITELKQAEVHIRNALAKEKELNELKSRFISMASHEFRTPLSAIGTSAILIEKQNMPGKEEKRQKYVQQIQSNVRNLVVILNDFLSLSKLEEGKIQPKPDNFDLVEFAHNLIYEMEPNRKRGQQIKLNVQQGSIPVFLDPKLLQHIFTNLLSNAIKYSDEGDSISVTLKSGKEKISIAVIDQGIGIPIAEQDNLFDRFFRAENSTNIQGTGLGLHIVKQYTELMGGKVGFESAAGRGTTFWVEFDKGKG